jgi:hypothetical protein
VLSEKGTVRHLRVGSIVDCLALRENAIAVVRAATQILETRGVDLIVYVEALNLAAPAKITASAEA